VTDGRRFVSWDRAWQEALYGPEGFYRRPEGPAGHFRTACHAGAGVLAPALIRLAESASCRTIIDVGAGRGELLAALAAAVAAARSDQDGPAGDQDGPAGGRTRLRLHGVDVVPRPPGLPAEVGWWPGLATLPDPVLDGALVVAWELLDVVPGPVAEVGPDGAPRIVLVEPSTGTERPGPPLSADEAEWCTRWWPLARAEIGTARDGLWADLVTRVAGTDSGGLLLAVDYDHEVDRRPLRGSLTGFRDGRDVPAVPDGSCDLTTHVALDSVAAAGQRAGAGEAVLLRQREALRRLGVGTTPADLATATATGTAALLAHLQLRSQLGELLDASGLGGFRWLLQGVRRPVPDLLHQAAAPRYPLDQPR
jgi:SAM-dependent MidA family methyltransferase